MSSLLSSAVLTGLLSSSFLAAPAGPALPIDDSTWVEPTPVLSSLSSQAFQGSPRTLTLSPDGQAGGYDSCNWFSGTWEQTDRSTITFPDHWVSTGKACGFYDNWLLQADSAEIEGGTLVIFDTGGNHLGTLVRE